MKSEYHRPPSLDEALTLLSRPDPITRPLAGGVHYRRGVPWPAAVVDLADLHLAHVTQSDSGWELGATTTLEQLGAAEGLPEALRRAALRQAPRNMRQRATIGGVIASRDSGTLLASLLVLEAQLLIQPGNRRVPLATYLQGEGMAGHLITAITFPAARTCAFAEISRTPADAPIVVVAAGVEAGTGMIAAATGADQPCVLLPGASRLLEGAPPDEPAPAVPWRDDGRGTAAYRTAMIPVLLRRAIAELPAGGEVTRAS